MAEDHAPAPLDLSALVGARTLDVFLGGAWQREPLHVRRDDPRYYDAVLTREQLDQLLNASDLRHPALQLAKGGAYYPADAYTRNVKHGSEVFAGVVDLEKVRSEYRSGATIVLPALHRAWPPLRALCEALETELGHSVHANAYLTPGGAQGFTPHYDTHDVFVLQIAGRKRWRIHEPPLTLPHHSQPFSPVGYTPSAPLLEIELEAGDLLYLPRGYVHTAFTSDRHSAHVTLGVTMFTWIELVNELLQACKADPAFREALPAGFARRPELREAVAKGLAERVDMLRARTAPDSIVDAFLQRVRTSRPRAARPFTSDVVVVDGRTELKVPPDNCYVLGHQDGNTTLEFDGRKLVLPAGVRTTLEAICARPSFRAADLPRHLDEQATLAFVRFLEGEGFLARAR